jgi:hypothetical protein
MSFTLLWGKLYCFIHYGAQYVVFIVTYIMIKLQFDICLICDTTEYQSAFLMEYMQKQGVLYTMALPLI